MEIVRLGFIPHFLTIESKEQKGQAQFALVDRIKLLADHSRILFGLTSNCIGRRNPGKWLYLVANRAAANQLRCI